MPIAYPHIALVILVVLAGTYDMFCRRIPNWLTIPTLALGLTINLTLFSGPGVLFAAQGAGLALLAYVPLYLLRGMGAGDVKLMAAIGALVGPENWFAIFLLTSLLGGVAAVTLVIAQRRFYRTWFNLQSLAGSLFRLRAPHTDNSELDVRNSQSSRLPHGAVIACGAVAGLLLGVLG